MTYRRLASLAGFGLLFAMAGFMLLQLTGRADYVHLVRPEAAKVPCGGEQPSATSSALVSCLYFDREVMPVRLEQGWSDPEPGSGVWSVGEVAVLRLPAPDSGAAAEVTLLVSPYIAPDRRYQRVRIVAGGAELGRWRLTNAKPATLKLVIPGSARGPGGNFDLQIQLPDADSPARLTAGATDGRLLAIKLHKAIVTS